ncbi:MAG: glutamate synthase large subunit, partial [Pseudomonadota bacterium]
LHLLDHPASVGQLNLRAMLTRVDENPVEDPIYLERDFALDDRLDEEIEARLLSGEEAGIELRPNAPLNTRNKTVGGQIAIDIERRLNHEDAATPASFVSARGRRYLDHRSVRIVTSGAAGQSFGAFCNDGMVLEHTGTCNDGVGKGACGGEIVVRAPSGGGSGSGQNVLIGNFALFGATGGRTFIEGEAGDRFAVRNSGATAVVEGVGDFCAEYMTNGAILNLGGFSKGFGNGMSGGFAYQYDPENRLQDMLSKDSVFSGRLGDGSAEGEIHIDAVRQLLTWHVAATGSAKAKALLEDWKRVQGDFAWIMPKALLQYQDADAILSARSRKDLVEELSTALAAHQIAMLKSAWKSGAPVHGGFAPSQAEADSADMYRLLNSYTVLDTAQTLARKRVSTDGPALEKAARNLILTEDFALMSTLSKHAKIAVADYDDAGLAVLVAQKRLDDFKRALSLRNILSMDSPGTYAWILHQDRKNRAALGTVPSFDELFARSAVPEIAARLAAE